jgi:acetolactate synthase-1/2/3 large subunit
VSRTGAEAICDALAASGIRHLFGVPGTQNVALFEALRRSDLNTVVPTSELAAAFAAIGYYAASGRPAAIATIPGPGFTWALNGLAEARADSAAAVFLVGRAPAAERRPHGLQQIDQEAVGAPLVKAWIPVERADHVSRAVSEACRMAVAGEPGPVVVEVNTDLLGRPIPEGPAPAPEAAPPPSPELHDAVAAAAQARRPVIYAGAGVLDAAPLLADVAGRLHIPVVTTLSGRGALPEDHPWAVPFDYVRNPVAPLNALLAAADAVLALGCKFTHNGTGGFTLAPPADRLIAINTDPAAATDGTRRRFAVVAPASRFLADLLRERESATEWTPAEVASWRARVGQPTLSDAPEPVIHASPRRSPAEFFAMVRELLPRDAIVVTDSGRHQYLVRRHFPVLAPRGLITPADYQSMGFAVPAAVGAALGAPDRKVVAVVGDGGFAMTGMDLVTAVRQGVSVTAMVFNDGGYGLIRDQQGGAHGVSHGVDHPAPDFEALACGLGVPYTRFEGDRDSLAAALAGTGSTLVEVALGESWRHVARRAGARGRELGRRVPLVRRVIRYLRAKLNGHRAAPRGNDLG